MPDYTRAPERRGSTQVLSWNSGPGGMSAWSIGAGAQVNMGVLLPGAAHVTAFSVTAFYDDGNNNTYTYQLYKKTATVATDLTNLSITLTNPGASWRSTRLTSDYAIAAGEWLGIVVTRTSGATNVRYVTATVTYVLD